MYGISTRGFQRSVAPEGTAALRKLALFKALLFVVMFASFQSRAATYIVDRFTDDSPAGGGVGSGVTGDLRYALGHAQSGDDISFAVSGTINLAAPLPTVTNNINVHGPGA